MANGMLYCIGCLLVAIVLLYVDIRSRIKRSERNYLLASRYLLKKKFDFLLSKIQAIDIKLDAYISIQSEARNLSLEALTKLGAIEKSTHSVQYIPSGTASDFIQALKRTDDPLMNDPDVDAQLEALEKKMMERVEHVIPDAI